MAWIDARCKIVSVEQFDAEALEHEQVPKYHLLGDSAYPLKPCIMVPYKDNGHLNADQKRYNICHSSSRVVIEHAFARLKGKFRRLKYLDMSKLDFVSVVVVAACTLHNVILKYDTLDCDDSADEDCESSPNKDHSSSQVIDIVHLNVSSDTNET